LEGEAVRVDSLREGAPWQEMRVRSTERGEVYDPFVFYRVWTVHAGQAVEEWLVMRREADGKDSYALCNAAADTAKEVLAWWKCQRYFIERSNQDAKSELGWDELQARKYLAWEHHLALTVLAAWFVAQTKKASATLFPGNIWRNGRRLPEAQPRCRPQNAPVQVSVTPRLGLKGAHRLVFRAVDIEDAMHSHELEESADLFRHPAQLQIAALGAQLAQAGQHGAESRTVNKAHAAQVEHEFGICL
jgi:hypothetical protein